MDSFYYYNFLKKQAIEKDAELLDLLKYELDQRIYYFGQHFNYPKEKYKKDNLKDIAKKILKQWYWIAKYNFTGKFDESKKNVISNSYFSVNSELLKLGFNTVIPAWNEGYRLKGNVLPSFSFRQQTQKVVEKLHHGKFIELLSKSFKEELEDFIMTSKEMYKKYADALIVPNDISAMERIAIKAFKDIQKPSFIFLHGLPGRYNQLDENRTDYLIVWGDSIKKHYVNYGFSPDKIFVSGHPNYKYLNKKELRFSLDDILVITRTVPGGQLCSDSYHLCDRGALIFFLFSLQFVLQRLGVKSVRFRPHPSENGLWYTNYIDNSFFKLDNDNLFNSIKKSSLIIGPTSTVMLESIYHGVNYVVYEPVIGKTMLDGVDHVPPFDGTDTRLPVAKNEAELYDIIKNKIQIDISIWDDYIKTPFDMSFLKKII